MGGAARTAEDHRYEYCGDQHCPRWPCQVYKQSLEDGHRRGYDEGHAQGYAEGHRDGYDAGYKQGFPDGIDACPRPHSKG